MQKIATNQAEDRLVIQQAFSTLRTHTDLHFRQVTRNITRSNPCNVHRLVADNYRMRDGGRKIAILSKQVRNLHELWDEWLVGIAGNLPAKDFTSKERGKVKHKYSKRLHIWRCISNHVRAGFTAEQAIDKIYQVFGNNLSVSKIIRGFQNAQREHGYRGHPNLAV